MEVTEESLYQLYDDMDTDELHELYRNRKSTLTDTALGVLGRVLSEKGLTTEEMEKLDEQMRDSSHDSKDELTKNNMNRIRYLLWNITYMITSFVIFYVMSTIDKNHANVIGTIFLISMTIYWCFISAKRIRNIGWQQWLVVLLFIPYIGILVWLIVSLVPSNPNRGQARQAMG